MSQIKILYVEDNEDSREAIQLCLEGIYDCTVDAAIDGLSGVEKALASDYGVILMDIGLPDISGVEAARQIKKQKPNQVIISSSGHAYSAEDMPADVFDSNFRKPFASQLKEFQQFCQSQELSLQNLTKNHGS